MKKKTVEKNHNVFKVFIQVHKKEFKKHFLVKEDGVEGVKKYFTLEMIGDKYDKSVGELYMMVNKGFEKDGIKVLRIVDEETMLDEEDITIPRLFRTIKEAIANVTEFGGIYKKTGKYSTKKGRSKNLLHDTTYTLKEGERNLVGDVEISKARVIITNEKNTDKYIINSRD